MKSGEKNQNKWDYYKTINLYTKIGVTVNKDYYFKLKPSDMKDRMAFLIYLIKLKNPKPMNSSKAIDQRKCSISSIHASKPSKSKQ